MHRDLDIEFPEYDEPTHVPTGDQECTELCEHSDCPTCGREVAGQYRQVRSTAGIVWLVTEAARVDGKYAPYSAPEGAITARDVYLLRAPESYADNAGHWRARAWQEGATDAVCRNVWLQPGDYHDHPDEQAAYMIGRLLVELHMVYEHLAELEARTIAAPSPREQLEHERRRKAERTTREEIDALRLPHPSAAGAPSAPTAIPTHGAGLAVDSGPGFESRAQHRARSGC